MHCLPHLCDPRVGALAVDAIVLQPLALGPRTVLLQGAAVLAFAPHTAKQRIGFQAQTAAPALGVTLVQMHCGEAGGDTKVLMLALRKFSGLTRLQAIRENFSTGFGLIKGFSS